MSVKVKICGITTPEDGLMAVQAGADALGLMFYEPSPRYVTLEVATAISKSLPPLVSRVGVFVNAEKEFVQQALEMCSLDVLQFHGTESPEYCSSFGRSWIKAFRIKDETSLEELGAYGDASALLLDSYVKGAMGGTGEAFNWELAARVVGQGKPTFLAGGLNPDNAAQAVQEVAPYALDVSSGVESSPGVKNAAKVEAFLKAVK
ncbi:phosphoribosylanthranilate isomerase [bacterium]|nr:phosphoribosylanthranilate isomerase [bacterium]